MKKGIHCWALPPYMNLIQKIRFAAETGFDGIELSITDQGPLSFSAVASSRREVREAAEECGIEIHSLTCSLNWQCSVTSGTERYRNQAKDNLRRQIDIATELGCGAILALPGFVGLDFKTADLFDDPNQQTYFPGNEVVDYAVAYERSLSAFQSLASYARERNVIVCLENIWNKFLLSPLEMRDFLDEIGSPFIKSYLDVGNLMVCGYPEHWIRALGKRIARVHLKDYRRGVNGLLGFVGLLEGDVDFAQVRISLNEVGYDGWVTAEVNAYHQHPELTAVNCMLAMKAIFAENMDCSGYNCHEEGTPL